MDDLEREIVLLFEPRWRRFGATLIRRRLKLVRDLAAPELVVSFCKSQLKKPHVQSGEYTPSLALCRDDFVAWLRARERAAPSNSPSASPPASPRAEQRPPREVAAKAAAIARMKAPR